MFRRAAWPAPKTPAIHLSGSNSAVSSICSPHPSETWTPPNLAATDHPSCYGNSGPDAAHRLRHGRQITFQPEGSDWSISAAIKYGKAKHGPRFAHDQTYQTYLPHSGYAKLTTYAFTNLHSVEETKHLILDFQAGKDVGLGLFGQSRKLHRENRRPLCAVPRKGGRSDDGGDERANQIFRSLSATFFSADMHAERSFTGIGPSIAWNGSVPIAGSLEDGLAFDWGANAALLFGRQKTKVRKHTEDR